MKKTKTLSLTTFFFALFIFTGCNTYMGYDAIKSQEDIPGTKRDLKETALDYRVDIMKVAPEKMITNIIGKYEVERTKTVADFENREHVELKQSLNTAAAMFLFTPIKCIVDCFAVYTPWGLASNPPGFFTQLTYIPPFSWFAIFQSPPYYFKDYHDLKEGVNTYERTNKYGQKETVQSAIKYVSHEKVEVSRKQVFYKQIEERFITDAKQIAEARKFLQEKADSGNTEAQINLAKLYFYGIGGKANPKLAISLLKKVESNGNCDTKELIKKYFTIPISDLEKAKTQQQKTTIQSNDKKTVKNTNKAIIRLQKKADDGDTQAMVSLALFCFRGRIVEHNPELAISLLKEAESKGNKSAAYFLKKYSSEVQTWEQQKKSSSALNTSSKKSNFPKNVSPAVKQQKNDYYCELFQFDPFDEKNFYNKLILQTAGRTMECQCGYSNKFYASVEAQATLLLNMRNPMNITEVKYLSSPSFPSSSDLQHECRWILQGSADKRTREKAYFIFSAYKIILEKTNFAITSDLSGGTGIIVDKKENNFIVLQVADGYSAKKAGIKENDQILAIGGENVSPAQSIGEIVSKLRGTPNTEVFVSIRQHLDGKIRTVSLKREPIVVMWTKKRFPFIEQQKIFSEDSKINCRKFADLWLKHIKPEVTTEKDLSFLWNYASFNEENNRILLSLCEKFNKYDWGWERRKDLLKEVAKTDNISIAENLIKSGTDNLEVGNALQIALTNDSCKVAELLLLTYVPYNFNYASALKITAANKDSKCLPMILSRKKFSLEELAYALDKAIKCNSTKNVRLILKYMDPLLKPEMSIGMNCAVPISKNNQEILSELTKRNIKISISSLADLIKFNSPKTIENVKFVIRDKKIWDLASPDMDSAMLASAETGNIGVLKLLIANGGEINCANDKDETPLIIARNKGHIEYVRYIASQGGTDSILAIKRYREQIKDKREKLKVQKRKDFFQQHRVRHAAEIKKLRQKFFNQKLAHADKATMDMLIDKSCKIIWYNDDYPQCMEAINLRLSSTPEKNKFYGTVDTVLAVEDLYPNYKNLYKKLNSFTSRRGAVADSDIQKKAGMIILTNALCSAWAEDDEINYMQTELNKMKEELDSIGPGLSAGMGIASLGIQRLTPIFIKILENAQTSKKTFKIMVKIEKGTDGLEYITVKSLDPHVMITDSNLY